MSNKNGFQEKDSSEGGINSNTTESSKEVILDTDDKLTIRLLEEKLDISKKWVQTGEVTVHKEILTEDKTITVPVQREMLIIEKKTFDEVKNKTPRTHTETIEIPVKEERIEIIKHPVVLEDISIYNRRFEKIEHIEETTRKEQIRVETIGDVRVKDRDEEKYSQFT